MQLKSKKHSAPMAGARITSVKSCLTDVPLNNPAVFATRTVTSRQYLLVRVETSDGCSGIGAAYVGDEGGEIAVAAVRSLLARQVIGEDPSLTEALWSKMYRHALLQGRAGSVLRAISAIDIALWDRNAKAVGLPIWRMLGGCMSGSVPAYASGGYYYPERDVDQLQAEFAGYVSLGFDAVKMKVGRASPSVDRDRVRAAREAIGPDVRLMMDANNAWPDVATAMQFLSLVEEFNPFWIEEPFLPDDIESHARLATRTSIGIAGGEIEAGRWRFRDLIERGAVQIAQPDMFACGGVSEWCRIATIADAAGIPVCTHAWQDFHAPLMASAPNAMFVEYFSDDRIVNLQNLLDRPLLIEGGRMVLSEEPGFGFEFNEMAVAKSMRMGWE
ncbi:mandelate racemase/muconate lactonizing enzyme family protein [Mesorhizobium sp. SB112]|uniref:mandelate racemase/muconate lactonizing enzyme family protein n=1 Tax=Mesorhizobium sp. SB112 TaxID=3151853 RepID=UPI003266D6E8